MGMGRSVRGRAGGRAGGGRTETGEGGGAITPLVSAVGGAGAGEGAGAVEGSSMVTLISAGADFSFMVLTCSALAGVDSQQPIFQLEKKIGGSGVGLG
jgi:hypothetical protein